MSGAGADILRLYEETGGLKRGHFQLTSGLHADRYLQSALVLQHPEHAARIGALIAEPFRTAGVQVVVGPAVGGIVLAHVVGRALGARAIYAERKEGRLVFYRGFEIARGERALVVEDVVTTGGSVRETIGLVEASGGEVVGVGAIVERSGGGARFAVPYHPLAVVEIPTFARERCPLCARGEPVVVPGSRGL
ncbi:MAG TPA: orotate phosphoribosyltransferase [Thermodesulfobacteriota bacterium]|nr:orotate phosphoribosyltransferase [Thermodesulfobacteriota bacterium]